MPFGYVSPNAGNEKYIALKIFADPEFWDKNNETFIIQTKLKDPQQKAANKQRICDNALLERYKVRAREIIEKFELSYKDWTLNQFEDVFVNASKQNKFKPYLENHIRILQETGHIGNAACYSETLRMLQHYDPKLGQRLFPDIDLKYVNGFDIYLQKTRQQRQYPEILSQSPTSHPESGDSRRRSIQRYPSIRKR